MELAPAEVRPARYGTLMSWPSLFVHWVHGQDQPVRIGIAAAIGTVLGWLTYEIIHLINWIEPRATVSWVLAFCIGVFRQHHLHRTLSFPKTAVPYGVSLKRDALASIGGVTASATLNFFLTEVAEMHHRLAWAICIASVGVIDYAMMKFFVFRHLSEAKGQP